MPKSPIIVLISANSEWRAIERLFSQADSSAASFDITAGEAPPVEPTPIKAPPFEVTPFGATFEVDLEGKTFRFLQSGWGKIAAAASTQYAIDTYHPDLLINLGTCGGFAGRIERGDIVLAEKTIVYDIIEQMGDFDQAIAHYTTDLDLSWLPSPTPLPVMRTLLVSGDRDLVAEEIAHLAQHYGAVAGDWESGAIAWTAARNQARLLILRGVTDLVSAEGGEAYGNVALFHQSAFEVMQRLVAGLPGWAAGF